MSATKNYAAWLAKTRKKLGFTYASLALKSGLSTAAIHSIEMSGVSPTLDTVEKLCSALGTSVEAALRVRSTKPKLYADAREAINGTDPVL